ncbi:DUF6183 family protein [Dactylosporangium sp. CA-139066]|uniref:DUF6183 family protein n=1 Tax=Dactylosporangium sp. CA-139066 TaxID=3239930 RepID=UPI003D90D8AD
MQDDPEALIDGLAERENVTALWELADRRVAGGDGAFVAGLGIALWRRYGGQPYPPWQYRSIFDRVVRLLALSPGTVADAVRLLAVVGEGRPLRFSAALLASGHGAGQLQPALGAAAPNELRACLLHELVLRGSDVEPGWTGEAWWREHPLAWLPAKLTALEGRPKVTRYTLDGGRAGLLPAVPTCFEEGGGPVPAARETTTEQEAAAIGAAVRNWATESNGHVAAHTYALDGTLRPGAVGATLRGLGLECLQGFGGLGSCTAGDAWQQLFAAASAGGAYNAGEYGAYGRLAAWRSAGALAGAPAGASAAETERITRASAWYGFAGETDWFRRDGWDIGLAAVSPDGRRLALLAATDTD